MPFQRPRSVLDRLVIPLFNSDGGNISTQYGHFGSKLNVLALERRIRSTGKLTFNKNMHYYAPSISAFEQ